MNMTAMRVGLIFLFLCLGGTGRGFARDAYISVSTGQNGHGFLRQRRDDCYVIMPKHVIQPAGEIAVTLPGGDSSAARLFKIDPSADLAILILATKNLCSGLEGSVAPSAIDTALSDSSSAILHSITKDGSSIRRKVSIEEVTDQTLTFVVNAPNPLQRGDSGSLISVGDIQVGMLLNAVGNGSEGQAYKQTVIEDFWKRVMPPSNDCRDGCFFTASAANLVKIYEPRSVQDLGVITIITTHYDRVYRVPDGIPLPGYFHIWQDKIETRTENIQPVVTLATLNFSFSRQPLDRDSELSVLASGFDIVGSSSTSFIADGAVWAIKVSREGEAEVLVTIKRI
jgi:hypothetical protein